MNRRTTPNQPTRLVPRPLLAGTLSCLLSCALGVGAAVVVGATAQAAPAPAVPLPAVAHQVEQVDSAPDGAPHSHPLERVGSQSPHALTAGALNLSTNWSGLITEGSGATYTSVQGSWVVPTVQPSGEQRILGDLDRHRRRREPHAHSDGYVPVQHWPITAPRTTPGSSSCPAIRRPSTSMPERPTSALVRPHRSIPATP